MKTSFLKNYLITGCFLLSSLYLSASENFSTRSQTLKSHLESLNCYWQDLDTPEAFFYQECRFTEYNHLIQTHLSRVIKRLEKTYPAWLPAENRKKRLALLDTLRDYCDRGIFPENSYHSTVTPYFIDIHNVACAVGHLIRQSGHSDLAAYISAHYNYDYIENMPLPEISEWAYEYGFDTEELKWIQPGYPPYVSVYAHQVQPAECGEENGMIGVDICSNASWEYVGPLTESELYDTCLFYTDQSYEYSWKNILTSESYENSFTQEVPSGAYLFSIQFLGDNEYNLNPYNQDITLVNDNSGYEWTYGQIKEGPGNPQDGKLFIIGEYDSVAWYNLDGEILGTEDTLSGLDGFPTDFANLSEVPGLSISNIGWPSPDYDFYSPYYYIAKIWKDECTAYSLCHIEQRGIEIKNIPWYNIKIYHSICNFSTGSIELEVNQNLFDGYIAYCFYCIFYGLSIDLFWSNGETGPIIDSLSSGMYIASYDIALNPNDPVWQRDTFYIEELCFPDCAYTHLLRSPYSNYSSIGSFTDLNNKQYTIDGLPSYSFQKYQLYEFGLSADSVNLAGDTIYSLQCFKPFECEPGDTGIIHYCEPYFMIETFSGDSIFIRDWAEIEKINNYTHRKKLVSLFDGLEIAYSLYETDVQNTCDAPREGILLCAKPLHCADADMLETLPCENPSAAEFCTCDREAVSDICTEIMAELAIFEGSCQDLECENTHLYFSPSTYVLGSTNFLNIGKKIFLMVTFSPQFISSANNYQKYLSYHNGIEQVHQSLGGNITQYPFSGIQCVFYLWDNFQVLPQNFEVCIELSHNDGNCEKTFCHTVIDTHFFGEDCYSDIDIHYDASSFAGLPICTCDDTYYNDINALNSAPQAILNWDFTDCTGHSSIQANNDYMFTDINVLNSQATIPIAPFLTNDFGQNLEIIYIDSLGSGGSTIFWEPGADSLIYQVSDCHFMDFSTSIYYVISDGTNTDTAYHTIEIDLNSTSFWPDLGTFEAICGQGINEDFYELVYYPSDYIIQNGRNLTCMYNGESYYSYSYNFFYLDGQSSYNLGLFSVISNDYIELSDNCSNTFTIDLNNFGFCQSPLPIETISFYGRISDYSNDLFWDSGRTDEGGEFILEHSADGVSFYLITQISNDASTYYFFSHKDYIAGHNYYRLGYQLSDGSLKYHDPIIHLLRGTAISGVAIYPNPANEFLYLYGTSPGLSYEIVNTLGSRVMTLPAYSGTSIDIRALVPGVYFIREVSNTGSHVQRFVKVQ